MAEWKKVKLKDILKQYRNTHWVEDKHYKQVTISQTGEVSYRGTKHGSQIGRKRQFIIDLKNHPNTLIFIRQGVYKGGIGICPKEVDGCLVTENMPMFDIVGVNPEYLIYYLKSPQFKENVDKLVPLGTAQKAVHERQLLEIEIFLPSLKEQERIIKGVKSNSENISELNNINNKNESYISKLRQQILQEAVQGKLVKQDPKDEPVSVLLKKIQKEKDKLIKEGKLKKEKPFKTISEEEIPYELPNGWEWVRLGDICERIHYGYTASAIHNNKGVRLLRITDIQNSKVKWNGVPSCQISDSECNKYILNENDILIARTGGTIGKSYLVKNINVKAVFASYLIRAIPLKKINPDYIKIFLGSTLYWDQLFQNSMGTGQPNVNGVALSNLKFPLPPLSEQKRIVEKVDKLMAYCDELENQVKESQENSERLMSAVLKESFEK